MLAVYHTCYYLSHPQVEESLFFFVCFFMFRIDTLDICGKEWKPTVNHFNKNKCNYILEILLLEIIVNMDSLFGWIDDKRMQPKVWSCGLLRYIIPTS